MRTIVFDTNVLLADPEALFAYNDAEIVIPETVLGELDKLKTARVDPELRFKGREVSRMLFELSEQGSLIEGVPLPEGGTLRVVPFDAETDMPEELSARNADDRILAVAYKLCGQGCERVTLITNDLNMLLKAQTLGVAVERRADGAEGSFSKRFIVRPFQRYKVPLGILAMSLAVFAAIVAVALITSQRNTLVASVPEEFRTILTTDQKQILGLLQDLQRNPSDLDTEYQIAQKYYDLRIQTGVRDYGELAQRHLEHIIEVKPKDANARTDLASLYWLAGDPDRALRETNQVLRQDPSHLRANFNLGVILLASRKDYQGGAAQFERVIELSKGSQDPAVMKINQDAQKFLAQVIDEAAKAGKPIERKGSTQ